VPGPARFHDRQHGLLCVSLHEYLAVTIVPGSMLDQSFLVATVLVIIALLFYILYWNRLLAFILSLVLRVVLWNKGGPSVWIQIGA